MLAFSSTSSGSRSAVAPCAAHSNHATCAAGTAAQAHRDPLQRVLQHCTVTAVSLCLACGTYLAPAPAHAVLNSPNAQIARSTDVALRRSTPAFNADVKAIQDALEDIQFQLRIPQRKPWGGMSRNVTTSLKTASDEQAMLANTPAASQQEGQEILAELKQQLERLQFAVERKDIDRTSVAVANNLQLINRLEVLQAPALSFQVPKAYRDAPLLTGRARVEFVVEKTSGENRFVDSVEGGTSSRSVFEITLDGYSAPVTAGKFAKLVRDGKFDSMTWQSGYLTLVTGKGADPGATLPLEILPTGEFEPQYRSPVEVLSGELPVLPLSIKGSCAMAKLSEADAVNGYVSGEEWFIYKFDPASSGLAGLSFDEGQFGVFGYVTKGLDDVVTKLEAGDRIISATLVSGGDKLVNA